MKYLSDYTNEAQTELFDRVGAFFAFGEEQFLKALEKVKPLLKEGEKIVSLGAGMYCRKSKASELVEGLERISEAAYQLDIKENGIKGIIHREFGNYECQITGEYDVVIERLEPYGITAEQVHAEWPAYWTVCVEEDRF